MLNTCSSSFSCFNSSPRVLSQVPILRTKNISHLRNIRRKLRRARYTRRPTRRPLKRGSKKKRSQVSSILRTKTKSHRNTRRKLRRARYRRPRCPLKRGSKKPKHKTKRKKGSSKGGGSGKAKSCDNRSLLMSQAFSQCYSGVKLKCNNGLHFLAHFFPENYALMTWISVLVAVMQSSLENLEKCITLYFLFAVLLSILPIESISKITIQIPALLSPIKKGLARVFNSLFCYVIDEAIPSTTPFIDGSAQDIIDTPVPAAGT